MPRVLFVRANSPSMRVGMFALLFVGSVLVGFQLGACGAQSSRPWDRDGDVPSPAPRPHVDSPDVYIHREPVPRPIAPLSTARVSSQQPQLRWELPTGADGARIELCRDRAMTRACQTIDAMGTRATPPHALASGVWFWRLRTLARGTTSLSSSAVWQFRVGARSAETDTSRGTELDVNGDGYTDLAVGSADTGRVDVFLGGPDGIASMPSVTLRGEGWFGFSVASAGDINGDGYGDLIVGAYGAAPGGRSAAGTVSVYLGGPGGLSTTPHRVLEGTAADEWFGRSVASAGDINGDGYADLIVGAPGRFSSDRNYAGSASVYLGGADGLSATPHRVLNGTAANDAFGFSVASAGDVNGDGYADVVVGAPYADPGGRDGAGTATVYLGGTNGLSDTPHRVFEGNGAMNRFGWSVASAGDVNGDGYADLIVGAPGGRQASVYLGGPSGLGDTPHRTLNGTETDFSHSVASAGDINGDGYGDVAVALGQPGRHEEYMGGQIPHAVTLYLGSPEGVSAVPHQRLWDGTDGFGASVASAGDVNGDGYGDLAVGLRCPPWGGSCRDGVKVYLGSTSGSSNTPQAAIGAGSSVAGATW